MALLLRTPPRLSGEPTESQLSNINTYMDDLYQAVRLALQTLDAIRQVEEMADAISDPPTQLEVLRLRNKLNLVIRAAREVELA